MLSHDASLLASDIHAHRQALCSLLEPILRAKYPDLSEEEERISLPLQARRSCAPCQAPHTRARRPCTVAHGGHLPVRLPVGRLSASVAARRGRAVTHSPIHSLSLSLQVLCLAIFDAVLVHILHAVAPDSWQAHRER